MISTQFFYIKDLSVKLRKYVFSHILICLFFYVFPTTPLIAQSSLINGTKFGEWMFECVAVTQSKTNCALSQTIFTKDGNQQLAKLNVLKLPGSKQWTMLVLVPLGIDLQFSMTGWIDKSTSMKFLFDTCIPNGCIGAYSFDEKWSTNLKNESSLSISFRAKDAKEATSFNVLLNGLLEAMKASNF